ncbi:MAG: hypothetical protein LBT35_02385 [Tannerella sp.]|jgi:hypothetical protein|nr:hypothetical protein [Tannerella sp.]
MKVGLRSSLKPVFTTVENFSDQPKFGRQVGIGRLPDFPLLLERVLPGVSDTDSRAKYTKKFHSTNTAISFLFEESHLSFTHAPLYRVEGANRLSAVIARLSSARKYCRNAKRSQKQFLFTKIS